MMGRASTLFITAVIILSIAAPVSIIGSTGIAEASSVTGKPDRKLREKVIRGEVRSVDADARTISVRAKDEIVIAADTEMLRDIKIGDKVIVKYVERDGQRTAVSVRLDQKKRKGDSGN